MPTYHVAITRILELSATITVRATNLSGAEDKATKIAGETRLTYEIDGPYEWTQDENRVEVDRIEGP